MAAAILQRNLHLRRVWLAQNRDHTQNPPSR